MKVLILFLLAIFSHESSADSRKDCFIEGEGGFETCFPNPAGPREIEELKALGKTYNGTDKTPARVEEICKGNVKCKAIYLWERNNKPGSGLTNPLTDVIALTKVETDIRLQQRCNCSHNQAFSACRYYKEYLDEVIPHTRGAICAAIGCEKQYESERQKREAYLRLRVPPEIFTVAGKFPKAFIDPLIAGDEFRAYLHVTGQSPELEGIAREEFKGRLCRREKQLELGSDVSQCELFVDELTNSRRMIAGNPVRP